MKLPHQLYKPNANHLEGLNLSKLTPISIYNLKRNQYFQSRPGMISNCPDVSTLALFTEDPELGRGWKARYFALAGQGYTGKIDREFLAPEGLRLKSTEAVIQYLYCSNQYNQKYIDSAKKYLGLSS